MVVCDGNGDDGVAAAVASVQTRCGFRRHLKNRRKNLGLIFIWRNSNSISVHLPGREREKNSIFRCWISWVFFHSLREYFFEDFINKPRKNEKEIV